MANLSNLVHELRERIAASTSPSTSSAAAGEDPLETRFRTVLPNLLHAYVIPSSTANEREVTAVLKLLSHTARNYPGVFFHGRAAAVLPVVGRILPFLAEPAFRSRHEVVFETVASLLSLLRTGEREAYRQFFLDAMIAIQDILYVASSHASKSSTAPPSRVSLKCFCESFAAISTVQLLFSELPACCRPKDGPGVLVDLTDKPRWQHFAAWTIKLVTRCLTEGTLYVEGLVNMPFVSASCSLLCYGDAGLHMACFDFARIMTTVIDANIVPVENMIRSIACILEQDEKELAAFSNTVYDSSVGTCLHILHSTCQDDVVESTASDIVNVFPKSIHRTESCELQIAMCSAYIRIAKLCPPHIWRPGTLVNMLCSPKPCLPLIGCIQVAISISYNHFREVVSLESAKELDDPKVGEKRSDQNSDDNHCKRQKAEDMETFSRTSVLVDSDSTSLSTREQGKLYDDLQQSLFLLVGLLKPGENNASALRSETAIAALSLLGIAFHGYPDSSLSIAIFQQVLSWIPWICKKAKDVSSFTFDLCIYLEAVHSILLLQGFLHNRMSLFNDDNCLDDLDNLSCARPRYADLIALLQLAWTNSFLIAQTHPFWKIKCLSIQILSIVGSKLNAENDIEVLELAMHDEAEEVRAEAAIAIPVIVLCSGHNLLADMFKRLEYFNETSFIILLLYGDDIDRGPGCERDKQVEGGFVSPLI